MLLNRDLVRLSNSLSKINSNSLSLILSILNLTPEFRSKHYLRIILSIIRHSKPNYFEDQLNRVDSDEKSFEILKNLDFIKIYKKNENVFFQSEGLLILLKGSFLIKSQIFEVNLSKESEFILKIGKIDEKGFFDENEQFSKNSFLRKKSSIQDKNSNIIHIQSLETSGFLAYLSDHKLQSIIHEFRVKQIKSSIYELSQNSFFKDFPKKTLFILYNRLFMEKEFNFDHILNISGIIILKSGSLEILNETFIDKKKIFFRITCLIEGEAYEICEEKGFFIKSVSSMTKIYWLTKEKMNEFEKLDKTSYDLLKEKLKIKRKIHMLRYESLLNKYKEIGKVSNKLDQIKKKSLPEIFLELKSNDNLIKLRRFPVQTDFQRLKCFDINLRKSSASFELNNF